MKIAPFVVLAMMLGMFALGAQAETCTQADRSDWIQGETSDIKAAEYARAAIEEYITSVDGQMEDTVCQIVGTIITVESVCTKDSMYGVKFSFELPCVVTTEDGQQQEVYVAGNGNGAFGGDMASSGDVDSSSGSRKLLMIS